MANLGNYPSTPSFNGINFNIRTQTQQTTSLSNRTFRNAVGTTQFTVTASYPTMTRTEFKPVMAFIAQCRGPLNEFDIQIPEISEATGTVSGSLTQVNGTHAAGDSTIDVDGLAASTTVLKAGDVIRFENHTKVYMLTADLTSDSSGEATMNITPGLITGLSNNELVTIDDVPFRMRLANDVQEMSLGLEQFFTFEVDLEEVI